MIYATLFFPLLVSGIAIGSNEPFNCETQNSLMFRKLKAFEENRNPLPHTASLNCGFEKEKRGYSNEQHFEVNETKKSSIPKSTIKPSPILEICKKNEHLIQNAGDLLSLQVQCEDITGDIRFETYRDAIIDFGNLQTIGGSLYIENISNIVKIQGNKLQKIGGKFMLHSLTSLVSLDMPSLRDVREIEWKVVPILNTAYLNKDMKGLKRIVISDSSLSVIEEFDKIKEVDVFDINNNRFLEKIKANIEIVRQKLSINANAKQLELELPMLESARNITIRDTSLISLPKLESVGSSLELIENDFTSVDFSVLKSIGGSLGIIDNANLDLIDFGNITDIQGGLIIENNPRLLKIDAFGNLKQIGGGIYFEGKFSETNFPQLKLVKGSAYVKSDSDSFDCSKWTTPKNGRSFIRGGKINCISGKTEESESVDTDGNVLDRTDKTEATEKNGSSSKIKHGFFSKVSHSGATSNEIPGLITWILAAITSTAFLFV